MSFWLCFTCEKNLLFFSRLLESVYVHPALVEAGRVICLSVSVSLLARLVCPFASRVYCDCRKSVRWRNLLLCISICTGPVDYISFSFLFFSSLLVSSLFDCVGILNFFSLSQNGEGSFLSSLFPILFWAGFRC